MEHPFTGEATPQNELEAILKDHFERAIAACHRTDMCGLPYGSIESAAVAVVYLVQIGRSK